jgi:hypothetical protein
MAIIGGSAARNMQNVAHPIHRGSIGWRQCKYCLWAWAFSPSTAGSIHWRGCPNLLRARVQLPRPSIPTTGGGLGRRMSFSFFYFPFFSNFQLVFACVCVVFSVFI